MTMTLVSTVTVGSGGAASIEFTGIAGTATDLILVWSGRSTNYGTVNLTFNNSTSGYSYRYLEGSGSSAASYNASSQTSALGGYATDSTLTANTFSNVQTYIPNYAGSTNKSFSIEAVTENNATTAYSFILAGLWANTSAITSLKLTMADSPYVFAQYSTASLYTITKGSGGATVS